MSILLTHQLALQITQAVAQVVLAGSSFSAAHIAQQKHKTDSLRSQVAKAKSRFDSKAVSELNVRHGIYINSLERNLDQAHAQRFMDEFCDSIEYLASDSTPFNEARGLADMIIGCVHQRLLAEMGLSGTPRLDFSSFRNSHQLLIEEKMRRFRPQIYTLLGLQP